MKALRKSLNKDAGRTQISTPLPLPSLSRPSTAITPPQKVIRALSSYRPQAPQELPFQKGDFFYILKDDDQSAWYEAHNPVSGARGLVPRSMFEEFGKSKQSLNQKTSPLSDNPTPPRLSTIGSHTPSQRSPRGQIFYAVVLHDFIAERADELDAKRGDSISVVAQSNREWFVAKPIGRLGRPGLIPVSFVEIRNPATGEPVKDIEGLMDRGELPKVEDWKRSMLEYKQNSIALGVIEEPQAQSSDEGSLSPQPSFRQPTESSYTVQSSADPTPEAEPPIEVLPPGILLSAEVVSFHYEMDEYWFRIDAIYQPYAGPGESLLPAAKQLVLFRVYNDFYDFQVRLLDTFPKEAGRQPPEPRILPYMPGPVQVVDDTVTASRRGELDEFVHHLCDLAKVAKHVLEDWVVREFLSLKPGDVQSPIEPRYREMENINKRYKNPNPEYDLGEGEEVYQEAQDRLGRLKLSRGEGDEGSEHEDEGYATSPQRSQEAADRHPYANDYGYQQEPSLVHQRIPHLRANSASSHRTSEHLGSRSHSPVVTSQSRASDYRNSDYNNDPPQSARSSAAPSIALSARSTAAKVNTPPISAANPQPAYVKIKVFDRISDDVIALRVHPRISHGELLEKVQGRLGGEVTNLRYRNSGVDSNLVDVDNDASLRSWFESTNKYVLYAE